jgi:hypothetical protein
VKGKKMPDNSPDPAGERVRIDAREFSKVHIGSLEVSADGEVTIRQPQADSKEKNETNL